MHWRMWYYKNNDTSDDKKKTMKTEVTFLTLAQTVFKIFGIFLT